MLIPPAPPPADFDRLPVLVVLLAEVVLVAFIFLLESAREQRTTYGRATCPCCLSQGIERSFDAPAIEFSGKLGRTCGRGRRATTGFGFDNFVIEDEEEEAGEVSDWFSLIAAKMAFRRRSAAVSRGSKGGTGGEGDRSL